MPAETKDLEASLARMAQELDHLKDGLALLGVKPCSSCGKYFQDADGKTLLDAGQLVCYDCLQDWWHQRAPALGIEQRQAVEHKILRWLVANRNAKVIRQAEKMPRADAIELKIVVGCEQCNGTGKVDKGGKCHACDGRGSVWVVGLRPEFE